MSAEEFDDATQADYFSDSETRSQPDSVLDIGTQFETYSPRVEPELEVDLSSQIREHSSQGVTSISRSANLMSELPSPSRNRKEVSGQLSLLKSIQQPQGFKTITIPDLSLTIGESGTASLGGKGGQTAPDMEISFDETHLPNPEAGIGCEGNPIDIDSSRKSQAIELSDSDDDIIFVCSRPRETPLREPVGESDVIKEEHQSHEGTWERLSASATETGIVDDGLGIFPGDDPNGLGVDYNNRTLVGGGTVSGGGPGEIPSASSTTPRSVKEIVRSRFVPKADVVKKIQASLMKKNMKKSTLSTRGGAGTLFGGQISSPINREEPNSSRIGAGVSRDISQTAGASVLSNTWEVRMEDDDSENAWMTQEIGDEDEDSDSYERLKAELEKEKNKANRLRLEVELITAKNRKDVRDRRRRVRSQSKDGELGLEIQEGLFIPDSAENVHKQRKRAHEASQRYQTPYIVSADEIEGLDVDQADTLAKRPRVDEPGSEDQSTREAIAEAEGEQETIGMLTGAHRPADTGLEQAPLNETVNDVETTLVHAITQDRLSQKTRKKPSPRGKTAKEVHSQKVKAAKVAKANKASKSSKAPQGGKRGKATKSGAKASKAAKTTKKGSKKKTTSLGNGLGDTGEALLHSLFFTDAIAQRQAQGDLGEAPTIGERSHKHRMLKELMASVPKEHQRLVTNDKMQVLKASKNFGYGNVKAFEGKWLLKGMTSPLYHHQLLGADWMVKRELGSLEKGGILADAMGLGKTLQMLATMVGNPPNPGAAVRATLLVVPSSVIEQWQDEICTHVEEDVFKRVLHFKRSKEIPLSILQTCDVIITSYAEVVYSYPYPNAERERNLGALETAEIVKKSWPGRGVLHQMKYYRVVLDEAHVIKNHRSRTSLACHMLDSEYRWALSGTPIHNRIEEIYSYFRFLRFQYTSDFYHFKKEFCDPDSEDCNARLVTMLSMLMIRRTLKDKMFNRPIVELPETHTTVRRIDFSKEERALYEIIEERFRMDFNLFLKEGTATRNYRTMVVKLLRLRQLTAHPFLLQGTIQDIFTLDDVRKLEAKLNQTQQADNRPLYERVGQWVRDRVKERQEAGSEVNLDEPETEEESRTRSFGRSNFGTSFSLIKYLNTLDEREMLTRCVCRICHDVAFDPQITDCHHVFCKPCIEEEASRWAQEENEFTECPTCGKIFLTLVPWFDLKAKEHFESPGAQDDEDGDSRANKDGSWLNVEGELLPSAKTVALKAEILEWMDIAPNEKIVIFTQFRLMGKIIGKICQQEGKCPRTPLGWGFCYFTGNMNSKARSAAVKSLNDDPLKRIMIAGLKCGGQGLNLTMACRVICIDLWWNHSVEQQAFGRVFRIGQRNQTHLTRFVVRGTVDDRLLGKPKTIISSYHTLEQRIRDDIDSRVGMQAEKSKVVDGVMMDDGQKVPQLSVEELASLFGYLSEDTEGNKIILPDSQLSVE